MNETRTTGHARLETRDGDSGELTLTGYASVFDETYTVTDWLGEYQETICAGAFTKTLAERDDVRLLFNHDGVPLARTKSDTLLLAQDEYGLKVDATLDPESSFVQDIRSALSRGDMDQMSFAFQVVRQEWDEDYQNRWVREAKLFDVSVVTYPANPATSAAIRSAVAARQGDARLEEITAQLKSGTLDRDARATLLSVFGSDEKPEPEPDRAARSRAARFRAAVVKAAV